jgi:hypothetical protein
MADVPVDFPRECTVPTVSGAQAKFMARKIDGRYVVGLSEYVLHEQWVYCEDLAQRLEERTRRKQAAGLVPDLDGFYRETEHRVRGQD